MGLRKSGSDNDGGGRFCQPAVEQERAKAMWSAEREEKG